MEAGYHQDIVGRVGASDQSSSLVLVINVTCFLDAILYITDTYPYTSHLLRMAACTFLVSTRLLAQHGPSPRLPSAPALTHSQNASSPAL
jgi:hypothetical protein